MINNSELKREQFAISLRAQKKKKLTLDDIFKPVSEAEKLKRSTDLLLNFKEFQNQKERENLREWIDTISD